MWRRFLLRVLPACVWTGLTLSPSSADDWNQAYFGLGLGIDGLIGEGVVTTPGSETISGNGPIGGDLGVSVSAGIDFQPTSMFVVGAFLSYDWSNIQTKASLSGGGDFASAQLINLEQVWTVGGRAGVLLTPRTLVYGLAGYSWMQLEDLTYSVQGGGTNVSGRLNKPTEEGITVGGGVEHKFSNNVALKAEYRYTDFGGKIIPIDTGVDLHGDSEIHMLRIGAAYRLGLPGTSSSQSPAPVRSNWTGFYFGGGVALDAFVRDLDAHFPSGNVDAGAEGIGGGDISGAVLAGYDLHISPTVIAGVVGYYEWSDQELTVRASANGTSASANIMGLQNSWTVAARLGTLLTNNTLLYGLIGYTQAEIDDFKFSYDVDTFGIDAPTFRGVTAGVGFENKITSAVSWRAEYRYTSLGDKSMSADDIAGTPVDIKVDPSIHSGLIAVSYKLN